jgi:ribosomal protein L16 Arg81 hydroxylase
MKDEYGIKFFKNGEEVEPDEIPTEYLNGVIQSLRNEVASRERLDRVFKRMAEQINSKHNTSDEDYE